MWCCVPAYDLVHVLDHDPGLEEERQVHDHVLVPGGRALDRLCTHAGNYY